MISCLGCAGNLCCECYGLLSPLGLGAWVAQAALDFGAYWPMAWLVRIFVDTYTLESNHLGLFIPQSQYTYARCMPPGSRTLFPNLYWSAAVSAAFQIFSASFLGTVGEWIPTETASLDEGV